MKYQPSGAGGLQRRTALKPKMATRGPQNGRPGLERGLSLDFGRCRQLSLNKFFDTSTPSMRKGRRRKENNKLGLSCAKLRSTFS